VPEILNLGVKQNNKKNITPQRHSRILKMYLVKADLGGVLGYGRVPIKRGKMFLQA